MLGKEGMGIPISLSAERREPATIAHRLSDVLAAGRAQGSAAAAGQSPRSEDDGPSRRDYRQPGPAPGRWQGGEAPMSVRLRGPSSGAEPAVETAWVAQPGPGLEPARMETLVALHHSYHASLCRMAAA